MATAATPALIQSRYDQADIVATIKATVAKGASDSQLRMFLEVCRSTGLDPFLREIWYVASSGIIMAGRDGYLRIANDSPHFDGMETRVERDDKNVPIKAVCTVWRKDRGHPIIAEAFYSEYKKSSPVWNQYPSAMISKVAEVLALKRSFSINGVVTEEEIGYDGKGSDEAAQEVAEAKVAKLRKLPTNCIARDPQPVTAIIEVIPEPEDEGRYDVDGFSQLEQDLHDSIELVESLKPKPERGPDRFAMLKAFAGIKKRYQAILFERTYYAFLGQYGLTHSNQFPDSEEGLSQARCCFKEMSLDVANREVRWKK